MGARARACACVYVVVVVTFFSPIFAFLPTYTISPSAGNCRGSKIPKAGDFYKPIPFHNLHYIAVKIALVAMQLRRTRKRLKPNSDRFKLMHLFHKNAINSPFDQLGIIEFEMMLVRSPTFIVDVA